MGISLYHHDGCFLQTALCAYSSVLKFIIVVSDNLPPTFRSPLAVFTPNEEEDAGETTATIGLQSRSSPPK